MTLKIAVFLFAGILVFLKAQGPRPAFAVASVKPSDSKDRPAVGNFNGRGYGRNATLKMLIQTAYQVQPFQISGGPAWIGSDRFEVEGKADDPKTPYPQLRLMMQGLLEDRFQLRVHKETRRTAIYSLVVAKARLKASADQTSPDAMTPPISPQDGPPRGSITTRPGMIAGNAITLSVFAKVLAPEMERAVIDNSGLKGRFDIRLEWTPNTHVDAGSIGPATAANGSDLPTIFTAIHDQLGLELKSARGEVQILVIAYAQKPSRN